MQPYPGSTQMPLTQRPPAPASVLTAVKVMYAGAATSVLGIVIDILTVNTTKADLARRSKNMTASQITSTQHALVVAFIAGGVIAAVVGVAAPYAGLVKLWGLVIWIAAVTAIVFLWRRTSSAYFKA